MFGEERREGGWVKEREEEREEEKEERKEEEREERGKEGRNLTFQCKNVS